jgi:hypothetical protein
MHSLRYCISHRKLRTSSKDTAHTVRWRLKAGIVERIDAAISRQWNDEHVSAAKNQHATIAELLEAVFSMQSLPRLYGEDQREKLISRRLAVSMELHC